MLKEVGKWVLKSVYFLIGFIIDFKDIYVFMYLLILIRILLRIFKYLNDIRDLKVFYCVKYIDFFIGYSCWLFVFYFLLLFGFYRGC